MATGAFSKKSDGKITKDSRMPSFSKDGSGKFEAERDTDEARNGKEIDDEKFENILNEILERSKDGIDLDDLIVVDSYYSNGNDEDESDEDKNMDNDNKTNNSECPDRNDGNPDGNDEDSPPNNKTNNSECPDRNDGNPDDNDEDSPPNNKDEDKKRKYKKYATIAGLATLGAVAVPLAVVPVALGAAGFGTAGVVGGSMAAAWQASIGNVAAGSAFALLQSAGAAGLGTTGVAASAAAGGGLFAGIGAGVSRFFNKGNNKNDKPSEPSNTEESSDAT